jgi:hypothetical protein
MVYNPKELEDTILVMVTFSIRHLVDCSRTGLELLMQYLEYLILNRFKAEKRKCIEHSRFVCLLVLVQQNLENCKKEDEYYKFSSSFFS